MNKKNGRTGSRTGNSGRTSAGNNKLRKSCDKQLEEACMSIIDEMSMASVAILPPMEQFGNDAGHHAAATACSATSVTDLFNNATWGGFRDSDLYFDQLSVPGSTDPTVTYCNSSDGHCGGGNHTSGLNGGGVEFSPVSMPASTIDEVEELFGCCAEENSNDCSCSDLLMTGTSSASLDLTIYGQVTQPQSTDWVKYVDYPSGDAIAATVESYSYSDLILGLNQQQQQQLQPMIVDNNVHYFNPSPSVHWESDLGASHRVLSILEPGLDFEGLIDLDNL